MRLLQNRFGKKFIAKSRFCNGLLLCLIFSCSTTPPAYTMWNSEIICPQSSYHFLILHSSKAEVEESIRQAVVNFNGNKRLPYTVLHLPNKRSTSVYNITPQEIQRECFVVERPRNIGEGEGNS